MSINSSDGLKKIFNVNLEIFILTTPKYENKVYFKGITIHTQQKNSW